MQTRKGSIAEAVANTAVGWTVNFSANLIVLPLFGFDTLTAAKAFGIGLIFTGISLARSYILRRWFNGLKFGNRVEPGDGRWRDPRTGLVANFPFPGGVREP